MEMEFKSVSNTFPVKYMQMHKYICVPFELDLMAMATAYPCHFCDHFWVPVSAQSNQSLSAFFKKRIMFYVWWQAFYFFFFI